MNAFECPFGNSGLPRNMHDTKKAGVGLKLVWLERGHPRATAGFPDFGKQLTLLAKQSAKTMSREGT
ncbi:hypothetical protein BZD31_25975 [Salmonella enterica]|nr:hypothetical protein [Salmonella enterica]